MNYVEMGLKIRILREEKRLSQMMLSELAGITDRELSNIESGKVNPLFSTVCDIARALNTSLDYLASEEKEPGKEILIHEIAERVGKMEIDDIVHILGYIKFYENNTNIMPKEKEVAVCK